MEIIDHLIKFFDKTGKETPDEAYFFASYFNSIVYRETLKLELEQCKTMFSQTVDGHFCPTEGDVPDTCSCFYYLNGHPCKVAIKCIEKLICMGSSSMDVAQLILLLLDCIEKAVLKKPLHCYYYRKVIKTWTESHIRAVNGHLKDCSIKDDEDDTCSCVD